MFIELLFGNNWIGKNLKLKNKNIVITGGAGGLGEALALEF